MSDEVKWNDAPPMYEEGGEGEGEGEATPPSETKKVNALNIKSSTTTQSNGFTSDDDDGEEAPPPVPFPMWVGKVTIVCDVVVNDPPVFDMRIFDSWLTGMTAPEVVRLLSFSSPKPEPPVQHFQSSKHLVLQGPNDDHSAPLSDASLELQAVYDQFRNFYMLEHELQTPTSLKTQRVFQLDPQVLEQALKRYFSYDDSVMREIVGRKLSSKLRKELDDISEKTNTRLFSCQRQFSNLHLIYRTVKNIPEGNIVEIIREKFALPYGLSKQYALLCFLSDLRIDSSGSKKTLAALPITPLLGIAEVIMQDWAGGSLTIDPTFMERLRDIKPILFDTKRRNMIEEYRKATNRRLGYSRKVVPSRPSSPRIAHPLCSQSVFANILRGLLSVSGRVTVARGQRDFLVEVGDKILDVMNQFQLSKQDISTFFEALSNATSDLPMTKGDMSTYVPSWKLFLSGVSLCILHMHPYYAQPG